MRPGMYGASDWYRVRSSTWPASGFGTGSFSMRKSAAVGAPRGLAFSTMRRWMVALCDMELASLGLIELLQRLDQRHRCDFVA